ncbi:MAG: Phi13 family phage major tail protein [Anaerocolumna sp.]|jgi:phi13 family phage major tail protein|nr:Phi13 family phage major tail protein [Anaerocolumna sp.]
MRQIGLRDVSFAPLTDNTDIIGGTAQYGNMTKYERSVSAKITPKSTSEMQYSDDNIEEIIQKFDSIDVEIELNQLGPATRAFLQGSQLINGVLVENKNDVPPWVAMSFRSLKSDKVHYRYVCLFKGQFELTADNYDTDADKLKTQTATLKATFIPRESDGNWRLIADDDEPGVDINALAGWLTAVPTIPPSIAITSITLNKTTDSIVVGANDTLIVTYAPTGATNKLINWTTSNPLIATVNGSGKVTAVAAGTATITATTVDGNKTATCVVTVTAS